jgi:outer membrane protein TolC
VRVAEATRTRDLAYEADVANFVTRVIVAYWRVVAAREAVAVREEAKALADRTVEENEARVRVGLFAPVAVLEAQADAKSREEQLITANNELDIARQDLAQIAYFRPNGTFVPRTLEPVKDVALEEIDPDVDRTLETALAERPEIAASKQGVRARQVQERIANNALLPRLDVVGGYSVNGLSGTGQPATTTFISSTDLSTTNPAARCELISVGIYRCSLLLAATSALDGTRGDAYSTRPNGGLFSGDFDTYSFGLRLTVPIGNAAAEAQQTRSRIELDQAEFNHRDLLSQVTLEVRQSVADLVAGRQRIDTSRVARELADENLRNQEKRHEVGMATEEISSTSRPACRRALRRVRAKLDYNIGWPAGAARRKLLAEYQIVVERPGSTRFTPGSPPSDASARRRSPRSRRAAPRPRRRTAGALPVGARCARSHAPLRLHARPAGASVTSA